MLNITLEQLEFLKKFIIQYDNIQISEYLNQKWWTEDYEKKDVENLYREYPELMYMISPILMYRLQKFYNCEMLQAEWCGVVSLSRIYELAKRIKKY